MFNNIKLTDSSVLKNPPILKPIPNLNRVTTDIVTLCMMIIFIEILLALAAERRFAWSSSTYDNRAIVRFILSGDRIHIFNGNYEIYILMIIF